MFNFKIIGAAKLPFYLNSPVFIFVQNRNSITQKKLTHKASFLNIY
jgi:hypothetical protein